MRACLENISGVGFSAKGRLPERQAKKNELVKNKHPGGQRQTALHSTGVDPPAVFLALPQTVPPHKTSPPFRPHLLDPGRYERVQRAGFARAGVRRAASLFNHNGQDGDKLFKIILGLRF